MDEPTEGIPDRPRRRRVRWWLAGLTGLALLWAVAVAALLWSARSDLEGARDDLRALRDDVDPEAVVQGDLAADLRSTTARLRDANAKIDNPVTAPLRLLPVAGRHLRSADALSDAAADISAVAARTVDRAADVVESLDGADSDRVAAIRGLARLAGEAHDTVAEVPTGPSDALAGPLHEAREELLEERVEILDVLGSIERGAGGLADLLEGPSCHLLIAANNAEMRAGSGMFLQAGELCFQDGQLSLGDMIPTGELEVADGAVVIADTDLAARWGILRPDLEFRNLGLSPRFPASAELAVEHWRAATGRALDGAIAVDPLALEAILDATGPVTVDDRRYAADDVVEELLVEQYEGFLDPDYDADARQATLGQVASAVVGALDGGGWDPDDLVDGLADAVAGRHLLAWSADPSLQRTFEDLGADGRLGARSIAVNVLNRGGGDGGGKLDPLLRVDASLRLDERDDGTTDGRLVVTLRNRAEPGEPTYTESPDPETVRYGVYQGILTVHVPGVAQGTTIEDQDSLYVVGADGPTRVVGARFELAAGERSRFVVRFTLPATLREVRIEPSARWPSIRWSAGGNRFRDVETRGIDW